MIQKMLFLLPTVLAGMTEITFPYRLAFLGQRGAEMCSEPKEGFGPKS